MSTDQHAVGIYDFLNNVVLQPKQNVRRCLDNVFVLCRELMIGKFSPNCFQDFAGVLVQQLLFGFWHLEVVRVRDTLRSGFFAFAEVVGLPCGSTLSRFT